MDFKDCPELLKSGLVKWFDIKKGFGFIVDEAGRDIFVHFKSIEGEGFRHLVEGERVLFAVEERAKGLFAVYVRQALSNK